MIEFRSGRASVSTPLSWTHREAFARIASGRRRFDTGRWARVFRKSVGGGGGRSRAESGSLTRRPPALWCGRPNHKRAGQTACGGLWRTPANGPDVPGRQGVRGSNPLSSTHKPAGQGRSRRCKSCGRCRYQAAGEPNEEPKPLHRPSAGLPRQCGLRTHAESVPALLAATLTSNIQHPTYQL
jgi:hypothetical protein